MRLNGSVTTRTSWRRCRPPSLPRLPESAIPRDRPYSDGSWWVDIGCGAGTDLLLAARRIGSHGRAIGVDMTEAMREGAARRRRLQPPNVDVRDGDATNLPVTAKVLTS